MQLLSLFQAIILLHPGEPLSRKKGNGQLIRNAENLASAKELIHQVLGRNLREMPRETQLLFLLIEKMAEEKCAARKIEISAYRFTKEELRITTGWRDRMIREHLTILENTGYLVIQDMKYRILLSSRIINRIKFKIIY